MMGQKIDRLRRALLAAPLGAIAGGWLWPGRGAYGAQKATLMARPVEHAPDEPDDPQWAQADTLDVPLAPQAVVKPRTYEASIRDVKVHALYDPERLALLIEWGDPQPDAMSGQAGAFRDAVALAFPTEPTTGIPYFGMGERQRPVTIYQWKADWQSATRNDVDEKYPNMAVDWYPYSGRAPGEIAEATDYVKENAGNVFHTSWAAGNTLADPTLQTRRPVEKLQAQGFGTVAPVASAEQDGTGKGVWKDGVWKTVITIPRTQQGFNFDAGRTFPIAFAAWDGTRRERGAEKAVSTWYFLSLEQPLGIIAYIGPLAAIAGAFAVQAAGLRWLQRRRAVKARDRKRSTDRGRGR